MYTGYNAIQNASLPVSPQIPLSMFPVNFLMTGILSHTDCPLKNPINSYIYFFLFFEEKGVHKLYPTTKLQCLSPDFGDDDTQTG